MKARCISFIFTLSLFACVCKAQLNSEVKDGQYSNALIMWKIDIPKGWALISDSVRMDNLKPIEKKANIKLDKESTLKLLGFKKDQNLKNPVFMGGIINRESLKKDGINSPLEFIKYSEKIAQRAIGNSSLNKSYFYKKLGSQEFTGYIFNRQGSPVLQKGLVGFRGKYLLYLTWVYQNDDDDKIIEQAVNTSIFTKN